MNRLGGPAVSTSNVDEFDEMVTDTTETIDRDAASQHEDTLRKAREAARKREARSRARARTRQSAPATPLTTASEEQILKMHQSIVFGLGMLAAGLADDVRPTEVEIAAFVAPLEKVYHRHASALPVDSDIFDVGMSMMVLMGYFIRIRFRRPTQQYRSRPPVPVGPFPPPSAAVNGSGRSGPTPVTPSDLAAIVAEPDEVGQPLAGEVPIPPPGTVPTGPTGMPIQPMGMPLDNMMAQLYSAIQTMPGAIQAFESMMQGAG